MKKYKIIVDFRKYNIWLTKIIKKHPNLDLLPFGNVPFISYRDGEPFKQYSQNGAAGEIASSFSDMLYDDFPEVNVKPDSFRQILIIDNISEPDFKKVKRIVKDVANSGRKYKGVTLPKAKIRHIRYI